MTTNPTDRMNRILDQLDIEDDDRQRSLLLDEALGVADDDPAAATLARDYGLPVPEAITDRAQTRGVI